MWHLEILGLCFDYLITKNVWEIIFKVTTIKMFYNSVAAPYLILNRPFQGLFRSFARYKTFQFRFGFANFVKLYFTMPFWRRQSQRSQRTRILFSFCAGEWVPRTLLCIHLISSNITPFLCKISCSFAMIWARFLKSNLCNNRVRNKLFVSPFEAAYLWKTSPNSLFTKDRDANSEKNNDQAFFRSHKD